MPTPNQPNRRRRIPRSLKRDRKLSEFARRKAGENRHLPRLERMRLLDLNISLFLIERMGLPEEIEKRVKIIEAGGIRIKGFVNQILDGEPVEREKLLVAVRKMSEELVELKRIAPTIPRQEKEENEQEIIHVGTIKARAMQGALGRMKGKYIDVTLDTIKEMWIVHKMLLQYTMGRENEEMYRRAQIRTMNIIARREERGQ